MFTGLIEDVGTVVSLRPQGSGKRVRIRTGLPMHEISIGDSIAVQGACLTVETHDADTFEVVAGGESLRRTALGRLHVGSRVHLERALPLGGRLDGHLVQGHVDGVGKVVRSYEARESWVLWVDVGETLARYVIDKGSICIDGVSLTVNEVQGTQARLNIIPHTAYETRLASLRTGDPVNVEVDLFAKYVEKLLGAHTRSGSGVTLDFLQRHGFTT